MEFLHGVRVDGPLAVHAVGFARDLSLRGYAPGSITNQLRVLARASGVLAARGATAAELSAEVIDEVLPTLKGTGCK